MEATRPLCAWCYDPDKIAGPKTKLCARCNRLRKKAEDADALVQTYEGAEQAMNALSYGWKIRLAHKRVELAKREGLRFGRQDDHAFLSGLTLEQELVFIARAASGKHVYQNYASMFERQFTMDEQRRILELLAPIGRAAYRKAFDNLCAQELSSEDAKAEAQG